MHSLSFPIGPVLHCDGEPSCYSVLPSGLIVSSDPDDTIDQDAALRYLSRGFSTLRAIAASVSSDTPDNDEASESLMLYGA